MVRLVLALFGAGFLTFSFAVLRMLAFSGRQPEVTAVGAAAGLIGLLCLYGAITRQGQHRLMILINTGAVIAGLYGWEIYIVSHQDSVHGKVMSMRAEGRDVVYKYWSDSVMSGGKEYVTLYGFPDIDTLFCNEVRTWVSYRADELGYNNPSGIWSQPQDVMLVGDSFTHGACEETHNTIAGQMRAAGIKAASAGYSQQGALKMLASLVETVARYKPPIVYWNFFSGNDIGETVEEGKLPILARYRDEPGYTQDLYGNRHELNKAVRVQFEQVLATLTAKQMTSWKDVLLLRNARARLQLDIRGGVPTPGKVPTAEELADFAKIMTRARDLVAGWGGELRFVYMPYESELEDRTPEHEESRRMVLDAVRGLGIPVIDTTPKFLANPAIHTLFNFRNGHYSTRGYAVVANATIEDFRARPPVRR